MPKIFRPATESKISGSAGKQLNPGSATAANLIGRTTASAGSLIQSLGQEFFDAAHASFQNAEYAKSLAAGTEQLNKFYNDRLRQPFDENGNPTYGTLVGEVNQAGASIKDNILRGIFDPETKQRFEIEFGRFLGNKAIVAQGEARRQHIDFSVASMEDSVTKLSEQAYSDDLANMNHYAERIDEIIQDSMRSGVISAQRGMKLRDDTLQNLAVAKATRIIDQNPMQALEYIERDHEETGLNFKNKFELKRQAEAAVNRIEAEQRKAQAEFERIQKQNMTLNSTELSLGILQGTINEANVEEALARGQISPTQRANLLKQVIRRDQKEASKSAKFEAVTQSLLDGVPAFNVSPKTISDHYKETINSLKSKDQFGQDMTIDIRKKAGIASRYKNPVKPIQKELEYNLMHGKGDDAAQAALAYEWLIERNPVVLDGMNKKSAALAAKAVEIMDTSNVSSDEAIKIAREVTNPDDDLIKERKKEFHKEDDFNDKLDDTVDDMFSDSSLLKSIDPLGLITSTPKVDDRTKNAIKNRLRDAYLRTGDANAAKRLAKQELGAIYGETEFNGGEIMMMPPEKVLGIDTDLLKEDLRISVAEKLKLDEDKIRIRSNEVSRNSPFPIWYIYKVDDFGQEVLVTNDEGEPLLWTPDVNGIQKRFQDKQVKELQEAQQRARNSSVQKISDQEFRDKRSGF